MDTRRFYWNGDRTMIDNELLSIIGIIICSGAIGAIIGLKIGWADAKKIYEPHISFFNMDDR